MKNEIFLLIMLIIFVIYIYILIKRYNKNTFQIKIKEKSDKSNFQHTLEDCKKALDSINVSFHLHSGTALGIIRDGDFIPHDNDIDIGVFIDDYKDNIISEMKKNNFMFITKYGQINTGLEYKFFNEKYNVSLDIFFIYKDKDKLRQSIFECRDIKNKYKKGKNEGECFLYMNKYEPVSVNLFGKKYNSAPISFLEDRYGKDWKIPKKFGYFDGIDDGNYKSVENYK